MRKLNISIRSIQQIRDFVALARRQPFSVQVGNDRQMINGKNFIGMSSLDYSRPLQVSVSCSEEEFLNFRQEAAPFLQ